MAKGKMDKEGPTEDDARDFDDFAQQAVANGKGKRRGNLPQYKNMEAGAGNLTADSSFEQNPEFRGRFGSIRSGDQGSPDPASRTPYGSMKRRADARAVKSETKYLAKVHGRFTARGKR